MRLRSRKDPTVSRRLASALRAPIRTHHDGSNRVHRRHDLSLKGHPKRQHAREEKDVSGRRDGDHQGAQRDGDYVEISPSERRCTQSAPS